MRYLLIHIFLFVFLFTAVCQQQERSESAQTYRIVFYNVENFFDPYVDTTREYNEFTYEGNLHWTYKKYEKKRNDIYKTLTALGEWQPLALVGLAEIENFLVLYELLEKTPFNRVPYKIVHFDSEDFRGIETGVLYNSDLFNLIYAKNIPVKTEKDTSFRTRDIIYLKGLLGDDTLHLFYNHWTSRYRGLLESKDYRMLAAQTLKKFTDSICMAVPQSNILIMGDFNDSPTDESIQYLTSPDSCGLTSLPYVNTNSDVKGTLKHWGNWSYFDQAIVSGALAEGNNGLGISNRTVHIFDASFLLEKDEKYLGVKPFRTNIGFKYNGGVSDHLPVYVNVVKSNRKNE